MRVALVGCGARKLERPTAAADLYVGELFRRARAYAERTADAWYVLSARYGVVHPARVLAPYDEAMADKRPASARWWGALAAAELELELDANGLELAGVVLELHAGRRYGDPLAAAGLELERPLEGLGIGERLAWYGARR